MISSSVNLFGELSLMSCASFSNSLQDASTSKGSFSNLPNIFGKYSGMSRPSSKLASVTANGPPFLYRIVNSDFGELSFHSPIAGRTRFCSCTFGPCKEQTVAKHETRAATSCDGVDIKLWRLNRDTRGGCLIYNLIAAGK